MTDKKKTPLDLQLESEKANTRVATTGEAAERETIEGDGVPVGVGRPFEPPVGTHEIPDDKGGPDGQEPTVDLVLREATLEREKEAQKDQDSKSESKPAPAKKAASSTKS